MKPQTWIFFVATFLAVCLAARTVKDVPRTDGPSPVLRILSRNVLYLAIAAAAVDATAVASDRLFLVIRWLGAGYLIYLGIRCLLFKSANAFSPPSAHASVCAFFLAILPQFLNPVYSRSSQIFILALTSILLEFFFIFPSAGSDRWFYRVAPRVAGVLLCASALGLARII